MSARTGCCKRCATLYRVSAVGEIVWRVDWFQRAGLTFSTSFHLLCGLAGDGRAVGSGPPDIFMDPVALHDQLPFYMVQSYDPDGDWEWGWSEWPTGRIVGLVRDSPIITSLIVTPAGKTIVTFETGANVSYLRILDTDGTVLAGIDHIEAVLTANAACAAALANSRGAGFTVSASTSEPGYSPSGTVCIAADDTYLVLKHAPMIVLRMSDLSFVYAVTEATQAWSYYYKPPGIADINFPAGVNAYHCLLQPGGMEDIMVVGFQADGGPGLSVETRIMAIDLTIPPTVHTFSGFGIFGADSGPVQEYHGPWNEVVDMSPETPLPSSPRLATDGAGVAYGVNFPWKILVLTDGSVMATVAPYAPVNGNSLQWWRAGNFGFLRAGSGGDKQLTKLADDGTFSLFKKFLPVVSAFFPFWRTYHSVAFDDGDGGDGSSLWTTQKTCDVVMADDE